MENNTSNTKTYPSSPAVSWAQDVAQNATSPCCEDELAAFYSELEAAPGVHADWALWSLSSVAAGGSERAAARLQNALDTSGELPGGPAAICLESALRNALGYCAAGLDAEEIADAIAAFSQSTGFDFNEFAPRDQDERAFDLYDWSALPMWMADDDMAVLLACAEAASDGRIVDEALQISTEFAFSSLDLYPSLEEHRA